MAHQRDRKQEERHIWLTEPHTQSPGKAAAAWLHVFSSSLTQDAPALGVLTGPTYEFCALYTQTCGIRRKQDSSSQSTADLEEFPALRGPTATPVSWRGRGRCPLLHLRHYAHGLSRVPAPQAQVLTTCKTGDFNHRTGNDRPVTPTWSPTR